MKKPWSRWRTKMELNLMYSLLYWKCAAISRVLSLPSSVVSRSFSRLESKINHSYRDQQYLCRHIPPLVPSKARQGKVSIVQIDVLGPLFLYNGRHAHLWKVACREMCTVCFGGCKCCRCLSVKKLVG
ncbi:hypothetical protein BDZ85DRAFT_43526 [Elsinoe ampelina]|uniref:Uncharacterized protein n=1 Tax=Elsinoe ampelina TaxID=302913 RepID=A0A6A6G1Z0_9PEZI|nr:hypothetical protein BDZ85DRAFT_43526 [Elsinoe ampelina]